ncbi:MAG: bifunctional UDP-3-O-[3-hydroxymyristoyl] N-acetylglucosamine deacetylase/3-hydroxyacyl-ACP dehydratase [Chitinophagales bacterium]
MNSFQHTIKAPIAIDGVGLHTGHAVTLTFNPAEPGHGIKFQRIDLPEQPVIPADCDLVTTVERGTTLEKAGARVSTVEHVMAALAGLQIDNVLITLNGPEVPILDGSAIEFVKVLEKAGIKEQAEPRDVFELRSTFSYYDKENGVEMLAMPSDHYRITTMVDYKSEVLGQQHASLNNLADFKKEICAARTFCFLHELEYLYDTGLIKGGDVNNAIVIVDKPVSQEQYAKLQRLFNKPDITVVKEGILNNVKLHHPNEPARHKLLDVLGDLALIGTPINANIIATRPGHKSNVEFAKKIKAFIKKARQTDVPVYDPNTPPVVDIEGIKKLLPHRYPFLLIDKVIYVDKKTVIGLKNVTSNEEFFNGHFPGNPVMPGVLQIEAMAQTGGILVLNEVPNPEDYDTYFLKIDKAKFKHKVVPGDTILFKLELIAPVRRGLVEMKGSAYVGNKLVAEAELMAQIVDRKKLAAKQ